MGILFPPFGFGDCQTLLPQGSCFVCSVFYVVGCTSPFLLMFSVVLDFVFELRFLYSLWSSFVARPLVLSEGVRVVLGRLPCPWSVSAFAGASSAF